ncbi:MAG: hypothetical protein HWN66_01280 [Candidatus Helarchaeota archaeon]|nr:hypothetical protein [Candidatus Helarchaeota archaeon]
MPKTGVKDQESVVLYKNKTIPRRQDYRLEISVCETEIKGFIEILKEKFRESSIQILETQKNSFKILVDGKGLEDPSCIIDINLRAKGENNTRIELDLDFSPYYKKVFKTGLIGILVVFLILTMSIGALDVQNLLSLGYLLGGVGFFITTILVLGIFVWNRSLAFHTSAVEALYRRLDARENDFIDQALNLFREKQLQEKPKEKPDTCYQCSAPIPAQREPSEVFCENCRELFLTCSVCLLNIDHGESVILCPHCNASAHRDHLREWLKIKNYCPYCKQKINEGDLKESN